MLTVEQSYLSLGNRSSCRFYFLLTLVYLLLTSSIYIYFVTSFAQAHNGWSTADWLINYSGGFCRRGLPGSIILNLNSLSGIPFELLVPSFQIFFLVSFFSCFLLLIKDRRLNFNCLFLITLPSFLPAYIWDRGIAGRKEIVLFALFALWCLFIRKRKLTLIVYIAFSLAISAFVFSHELGLFFCFYFPVSLWLLSKQNHYIFDRRSLFIPLTAFCSGIVLLLWGAPFPATQICQSIVSHGGSSDFCHGILNYPVSSVQAASTQFFESLSPRILYMGLMAFIIIFIPVVLSTLLDLHTIPLSFFILALVGLVFCSMPLFIIGLDWGRWVHIHSVLIITTLFLLLPKSKAAHGRSSFSISKLLILLISSFAWQLNNCCPGDLFSFAGPWRQLLIFFNK